PNAQGNEVNGRSRPRGWSGNAGPSEPRRRVLPRRRVGAEARDLARRAAGPVGHDRDHHFRADPGPHDHGAGFRAAGAAHPAVAFALRPVITMEHRWYAIQTTAGHENKVRSLIQRRIKDDPRPEEEKPIRQALVPTQEVVEIKNGKKVTAERKIYPGYVLVNMVLNQETIHVING